MLGVSRYKLQETYSKMTSNKSKLNPNAPMFIPESLYKIPANGFGAKTYTYWGPDDIEDTPSKHRELPVDVQQAQCDSLNRLKKNKTFRKRLIAFLQKEYCLDGIDIEKGCRIELNIRGVFNENYVLTGKKKKHIGFWFNYKQDGIIYGIIYECDVIDDPKTGWFFQNICDEECGGTCSLFECATAYKRE